MLLLCAVAYRDGKPWAEDVVQTTGEPDALKLESNRAVIRADGNDLSFIAVHVVDENGLTCPRAMDNILFEIEGPGEIVAADNGDPTDFTPFPEHRRRALIVLKSEKKVEQGEYEKSL